jgi:NAD(P)-dependent dehydrogenase (short-subunit alcohol dehydrogenase family)
MMNLHGQNMLITGGNGALGQAAARRAKALGATVFLLDLAFAMGAGCHAPRQSR